MKKPLPAELRRRIERDRASCGGQLPESHVIAWRAYLAGLLEWGALTIQDFDELTGPLPPVGDDPAVAILTGYEETP